MGWPEYNSNRTFWGQVLRRGIFWGGFWRLSLRSVWVARLQGKSKILWPSAAVVHFWGGLLVPSFGVSMGDQNLRKNEHSGAERCGVAFFDGPSSALFFD